MILYEYTKNCRYETRTARIFAEGEFCTIFIEGARDIYEFEAETIEDAVKIVNRYGFNKLVEVF